MSDQEVDNLSRIWPKPDQDTNSYPDPVFHMSKSDKEEVKKVESLWKTKDKDEKTNNKGIKKQAVCHACKMAFETDEDEKSVKCPNCGSNESIQFYL